MMKKLENIKPNKNDKRPIAKFYRSWLQDVENGVADNKCRGINTEQYRAADRLSNSYQRSFMTGGWNPEEVSLKPDYFRCHRTEIQVQSLHEFNLVFKQIGARSKQIIEHFCINEQTMRSYELGQIPQWPKGAGTVRLREALDELIEVYRHVN